MTIYELVERERAVGLCDEKLKEIEQEKSFEKYW